MLKLTRGEALLLCAAAEEGWIAEEEVAPKGAGFGYPTVEVVLKRDMPTLLTKLRNLTAEELAELGAAVKRFHESVKEPVDERLRKAGLIVQ